VLIAHRDQHGRCEYLSSIARDISDRKRFESELLYLATHDPLTALPNRRRFVDQLEQFLHQSHRYQTGGAVLLIDVDNFKYVNDSLGHAAGDELLQQLADLLRDLLRKSDIVARLGGDEFGIFLPFADAEAAACAGERLLTAIRSHRFHIAGQPITATASAGIALLPNHGQTVEELFTRADIALYNAKGRRTGPHRDLYVGPGLARPAWIQAQLGAADP
jgi:diguanylate cyclase (GGDEF)-like protein